MILFSEWGLHERFDPLADYRGQHKDNRDTVNRAIACLEKRHGGIGFREFWIFVRVFGDTPEARRRLYEYLHDVSTLPPEVERWCNGLTPRQKG